MVIGCRQRYAERGLAGLDDEPRAGRPRTVDHRAVIAATLRPPPQKYGVTHWSSRLLARHLRIGDATVARAWREYSVQPWRGQFPFLHRSHARGEGHRHRRAVPGAAGERGGAVRRREVADSGAGPHGADPAAAARAGRTPLPRLHPAPHHDPVRGAGDRDRHDHRRRQTAAPPPRVPGVPQAGRPRLPQRGHRPRTASGAGQLRRAQTPQGPPVARGEPTRDRALHPNPRLLDEPRRGLVLHHRAAGHPPRHVRIRPRAQCQDPRLHRRLERPRPPLHLDKDRATTPDQSQPEDQRPHRRTAQSTNG
jgi:hypothetical protein